MRSSTAKGIAPVRSTGHLRTVAPIYSVTGAMRTSGGFSAAYFKAASILRVLRPHLRAEHPTPPRALYVLLGACGIGPGLWMSPRLDQGRIMVRVAAV